MGIFSLRLGLLLLLLEFMAGCTHSHAKDPVYQEKVRTLCAPSAAQPPQIPASVPPVEPPLVGEHSLAFYVQEALNRNPEILAAERQVAVQAEMVPQVTSLPYPTVASVYWPDGNQAPQTAAGRIVNTLILSQQFPWCGKLRVRGEVAKLDTKIALTQLAETQLRVVEAVKLAYYEIYYIKRALKIIDNSEKDLHRVFIDPARAGLTKTAKLDLMRGEVELVKLQEQRIILHQRLMQSQADLAKLLSTSPETDLSAADAVDLPAVPDQLDLLYQAALISRPELQGKLDAVSRDERLVELARMNYIPDLNLGFVWYNLTTHLAFDPAANGENALGIALGINLPIWHKKLQAGIREAQNRTAKDARLYQSSRDEILRLIRRLTVQARAQERELDLLRRELVPAAVQTLSIAHEGHKAGTVNPVRVVDNWLQMMNLQLQMARLQASLGQTLASLERVVGEQLMPMKGVPVPVPAQGDPAQRRDENLPPPQRLEDAPPGEGE